MKPLFMKRPVASSSPLSAQKASTITRSLRAQLITVEAFIGRTLVFKAIPTTPFDYRTNGSCWSTAIAIARSECAHGCWMPNAPTSLRPKK